MPEREAKVYRTLEEALAAGGGRVKVYRTLEECTRELRYVGEYCTRTPPWSKEQGYIIRRIHYSPFPM